jgi:hypothetical protein
LEYEKDPDHIKPLESELVLEYDNGVPRLKFGDGIHEFSKLLRRWLYFAKTYFCYIIYGQMEYHEIPQNITAENPFALGERGWWNGVLMESLLSVNVWNPDSYPQG